MASTNWTPSESRLSASIDKYVNFQGKKRLITFTITVNRQEQLEDVLKSSTYSFEQLAKHYDVGGTTSSVEMYRGSRGKVKVLTTNATTHVEKTEDLAVFSPEIQRGHTAATLKITSSTPTEATTLPPASTEKITDLVRSVFTFIPAMRKATVAEKPPKTGLDILGDADAVNVDELVMEKEQNQVPFNQIRKEVERDEVPIGKDKTKTSRNFRIGKNKELDTFALRPRVEPLPAEKQKWVVFLPQADKPYEHYLTKLSGIRRQMVLNVYTGNYRGMGNSSGTVGSVQDRQEDAAAMIDHLLGAGVLLENIVIFDASGDEEIGKKIALQKKVKLLKEVRTIEAAMRTGDSDDYVADSFREFLRAAFANKGIYALNSQSLLPELSEPPDKAERPSSFKKQVTRHAILPALKKKVHDTFSFINRIRKKKDTPTEFGLDHQREAFTLPKGFQTERVALLTKDKKAVLDSFAIVHPDQASLQAKDQKWIVYFHGNDQAYEEMLPELGKISEHSGANILTGNYRGVGHSKGFPMKSADLSDDGATMVQLLLDSGVPPGNIMVHGFSMGGAVAMETVANLVAAYKSTKENDPNDPARIHISNDRSFSSFPNVTAHTVTPFFSDFASKQVHKLGWVFDSQQNYEKIQKIAKDRLDESGHVLVLYHPEDTFMGTASFKEGLNLRKKHKIIELTSRDLDLKERLKSQKSTLAFSTVTMHAQETHSRSLVFHSDLQGVEYGYQSSYPTYIENITTILKIKGADGNPRKVPELVETASLMVRNMEKGAAEADYQAQKMNQRGFFYRLLHKKT